MYNLPNYYLNRILSFPAVLSFAVIILLLLLSFLTVASSSQQQRRRLRSNSYFRGENYHNGGGRGGFINGGTMILRSEPRKIIIHHDDMPNGGTIEDINIIIAPSTTTTISPSTTKISPSIPPALFSTQFPTTLPSTRLPTTTLSPTKTTTRNPMTMISPTIMPTSSSSLTPTEIIDSDDDEMPLDLFPGISPIDSPVAEVEEELPTPSLSPTTIDNDDDEMPPALFPVEAPIYSPVDEVGEEEQVEEQVEDTMTTTAIIETIVSRLSIENFKDTIRQLSSVGDRVQGTISYDEGEAIVIQKLRDEYNYKIEFHDFQQNQPYCNWLSWTKNTLVGKRRNLYVTKVGKTYPDRMYIVSAHLDGRGLGGAANDDASGVALVLEMARVFATLQTDISVRFLIWNSEEIGMIGSKHYVHDRKPLQGQQQQIMNSTITTYPEPIWLGMIQHDQILYDHGPPETHGVQSPYADADIEYERDTVYQDESYKLAVALLNGNIEHAKNYPAEVSDQMYGTDSVRFADHCPSVSIRENRRNEEMSQGWSPHWHQPTDNYETYAELDYEFGFDIVRMTTATIAKLVNATFLIIE